MDKKITKKNTTVINEPVGIQEVKEILDALTQSEEKFNHLQENIPIGLFQTNIDGDFLFVNKWAANMLHYDSPEEMKKVKTYDLYADLDVRTQILNSLSTKGFIEDTEVRLKCKDNANIWAIINAKTIYINNAPAYYDGYLYNISERKKALEKLQESEEMFRAISENLKSALYVFNANGFFEYVNPAMCDITGYSSRELLGKRFYEIIHPEFREVVKKRGLERLMGKNVPKNYQFKLVTKSNAIKWIEISATKIIMKGNPVVLGLGIDISEHKSAIDAIKKSEQRYKTLFSFFRLMSDNVADMIWAKDLQGRYIFVNKVMCDKLLIAKNVDEPIGKTDMFFAERERRKHPDDDQWHTFGEICGNTDKVVIKSRKAERFDEYGNIQGKFLYLDVIKAPFLDENGQMIGTVGSARDVTKERQIEAERQKFERLQSVIFRISAAAGETKDLKELITVIRNELGQVIDTRNFFIALYDKVKDEIHLPYFIDEMDYFTTFPKGRSLTALVLEQRKSILVKEKNIKELEDSGLIESMGSPSKVWLGVPLIVKENVIGAIVLQNYYDSNAYGAKDVELMEYVSNQLGHAISQKQADDELRESEKKLRQIIDAVPHMIYAKNSQGNFILANRATAESYGLPVDAVEGRNQSSVHNFEEELLKFKRDDQLIFDNKELMISTEEKFTDFRGEEHILQTIKIPFRAGIANEAGLLGVSIDITDRKKFEMDLNLAKEKAEESDRLKTAFLANMSHEIRTPMNAIIGFSELLNDNDLTTQNRQEFVALINENSRMLLSLIEDIIDVAKIEAEQLKIIHGNCKVNQILDDLEILFKKELEKNQNTRIKLKVSKGNPDPLFSILSDPLRFKQVMNNLISNAIKFTPSGVVEFGYQIINGQTIRFFIKDTGIGLPADKLGIIFERFRQAEESTTKAYGGTGLGLTISRKLIELLGGKIWVESELNSGSTFYFTLPYMVAKENGKLKPFPDKSDKRDWTGKIILVAEDENSNFEFMQATLLRTNATIIRARNGLEAVDACLNNKIDLVLMDIRMPEMNGYEATRKIKADLPDLPVVSLTAYAMSEDRAKSLAEGCDDHISKPIRPNELIGKISKYLV